MRALKWIAIVFASMIVLLAVAAALNWDKVKRLNAVNTLFSEEKIVTNFSNMSDAFQSVEVPNNGTVKAWSVDEQALAQSYSIQGKQRSVSEWLEQSRTTSLLVVHGGEIAHEDYRLGTGPDDLRISWSISKSFLSAAFGIAVKDGLIDLNDPVEKYAPLLVNSAYEGVRVIDVLQMASGVKFNEDYLDFWSDINKMGRLLALGGSMDEFAADVNERLRAPGSAWKYTSIDTHVLAMVLRSATGKTLADYLGEKIISPLGFQKDPYYLSDSYSNAFALGGLNITTRDYARFGQMVLDNGLWDGMQVVPAEWIRESTAASAPKPANPPAEFAYGYQWWIPRLANGTPSTTELMARGIYGQYMYIDRLNRTVIVKTSAHKKFREIQPDGTTVHANTLEMFRSIATGLGQK